MAESELNNCVPIESNWMSDDYFETVLSSHFGDSVKIVSNTITPAAKKGENFASTVYRVRITYQRKSGNGEDETISLILKTNSSNAAIQEVVEEFQVFERELTTYKEVLVDCEKTLNSLGDSLNFSPGLIYSDSNSLVFEDASVRGYAPVERKERLDLQHSMLFIEKLAKFHGTTAFLYRKVRHYYQ